MFRTLTVAVLFIAALLPTAVTAPPIAARAQQEATPPSVYDLPEGITVELLGATEDLSDRPDAMSASLARYTFEPGMRLARPFPGPVLVHVEAGTLSLEAVGRRVTVTYPPEEVEEGTVSDPISAGEGQLVREVGGTIVRQAIEEVAPGAGVAVGAGGAVYAADGDLGPAGNDGDVPLVLLVVAFVSDSFDEAEATDEATPAPSGLGADQDRPATAGRWPVPPPEDCTVEPRPLADYEAPAATPPPDFVDGLAESYEEGALPGRPAGPETVAAIEDWAWEHTACLNAGDDRRNDALTGDAAFRRLVLADPERTAESLAAPTPLPPNERRPLEVRGVRELPDGRVGAIVDWCVEANFYVFAREGDRWMYDDETVVVVDHDGNCPGPAEPDEPPHDAETG